MEDLVIQEDFDGELYHFDIATPMYTWCMSCEQVYPTREWRRRTKKTGGLYFLQHGYCPNCQTSEEHESFSWQQIRSEHEEYPLIPTIGLQYPLHGWSERIN